MTNLNLTWRCPSCGQWREEPMAKRCRACRQILCDENAAASPAYVAQGIAVRLDALYVTDNGAIYCGEHLGASAKYTGRDISGQPIDEITPASLDPGDHFACERPGCGRAVASTRRKGA